MYRGVCILRPVLRLTRLVSKILDGAQSGAIVPPPSDGHTHTHNKTRSIVNTFPSYIGSLAHSRTGRGLKTSSTDRYLYDVEGRRALLCLVETPVELVI